MSDSGVGIEPLTLARLRKQISEDRDITSGGEHLGMINVHQRNRHLFGGEFQLGSESEENKGTEVQLLLPYTNSIASTGGYAG